MTTREEFLARSTALLKRLPMRERLVLCMLAYERGLHYLAHGEDAVVDMAFRNAGDAFWSQVYESLERSGGPPWAESRHEVVVAIDACRSRTAAAIGASMMEFLDEVEESRLAPVEMPGAALRALQLAWMVPANWEARHARAIDSAGFSALFESLSVRMERAAELDDGLWLVTHGCGDSPTVVLGLRSLQQVSCAARGRPSRYLHGGPFR
jgi:hypothetical protein